MRLANLWQSVGERSQLAFVDDDGAMRLVKDVAATLSINLDDALTDPKMHDWLLPEGLDRLEELEAQLADVDIVPVDIAKWRQGPPVTKPGKIIAAGRNYMDHVREGQEIWAKRGKKIEIPTFPTAFSKFPSSLSGPYDDILIPAGIDDVDYEIELAVIIGLPALEVSIKHALDHVAGYAICNDVAARGIQRREMEAQIGITLAKNFPTFSPLGPWLTTAGVVSDPQNLKVTLEVDGNTRQEANTKDMIFSVAELISYWSRTGLETGDILITGTPSGVALARENPDLYYLRPGQLVTSRIEKLGELRNLVR